MPQQQHKVTIKGVRAVITPWDPSTRRLLRDKTEKWTGTLTVTELDLVFRYSNFLRDRQIHVWRQDVGCLVETWKPILWGRPRMILSVEGRRLEFHIRSWTDVATARDLFTQRMR